MFGIKLPKLKFLSSIGKRDILSIEFDSSYLKIAYIKVFPNRKELSKVFFRETHGLSDTEISRVIRSCVNELQLKNAEVINVIPSHMVISKNIEIPSTNPAEIRQIIDLQAGHHTPYSREEVNVDYIDIGVYKRSYTKILLIILARSVIKKQTDILEKAGLTLGGVLLSAEGISRFIPKAAKIENAEAPFCVVHFDASFTDFTVVLKGRAIFIRSIPIGSLFLRDDRERARVKLTEELLRSLEAYQGENIDKGPNLLVLTGAVDEVSGLESSLNNALRIPVRIVRYLSGINATEDALRDASLSKQVSFLDAIAPAMHLDEIKVDLIPEEIKLRRSIQERGKELVRTGIYIMALFILFILLLASKIYFKGEYLKSLEDKYASLDKEAKKLEKDFSEVSLIRNYLINRGYSLDILTELHSITPLNCKLDDIRYDSQGKFSLRGTAESMSDVFSFVDNMEKSKLFKDVKTRYTSKRRVGTKDVADFEINSSLEREADK